MYKLLICGLFFMPCIAYSGGWSVPTKVAKIFTHATDSGGTIYFKFDSMINPDGCANTAHIALVNGSAYQDEIFSLYLSAYMGGKSVKYHVSGCTPSGYPQLKNAIAEE